MNHKKETVSHSSHIYLSNNATIVFIDQLEHSSYDHFIFMLPKEKKTFSFL